MERMQFGLVVCLLMLLGQIAGAETGWQKAGSPDVTPGEGAAAERARLPHVIRDGGNYKMWFEGYWGLEEILYARSSDGKKWETYAHCSPVVPRTREEFLVGSPSVIKDENGIYHMWYSYCTTGYGGDGTNHIAYARSVDGRDWERYAGNPIISQGDMPTTLGGVTVVKRNGRFHLWATGNGIAYATSEDGLDWKPHGKISFDEKQQGWIHGAGVTVYEGKFVLAFPVRVDDSNEIRFASSTDGKNWKAGYLPSLDGASGPSPLLRVGDRWMLWCKFPSAENNKFAIWRACYTSED